MPSRFSVGAPNRTAGVRSCVSYRVARFCQPIHPSNSEDECARNDSTIVTDSVKRFKWVGTRPIRPDGVPKVTGRAMYGADLKLPGMLYGTLLRSPHAHALIKKIDPP